MSKVFDATLKHLLELGPADWLACAGPRPTDPVTIIDSEVSTITAEADTVFQIGEPARYLAHVEIQAGHDQALPRRLLHYNVLLNYRHDLPVQSLAILLRKKADSPNLTGTHHVRMPDGTDYLDFQYSVVRVWELDVESILQGGLGLLPLAPLARVKKSDLPGIISRMKQRLDQEVSVAEANLLWTATNILMGLNYTEELSARLLRGVITMKESSTYQAIVEEGRERGRIEGRIRLLIELAEEQFGPANSETLAVIQSIRDHEQIKQRIKALPRCQGWADLLASTS